MITNRGLKDMARRMYQYSYRIEDRYLMGGGGTVKGSSNPDTSTKGSSVAYHHMKDDRSAELTGLCILTARAKGPPVLTHTRGFGNYGVKFTCPVLYLEQWLDRWDQLEAIGRTNPFAVIVMAQLMAQETHGKGMQRLASKTQVASLLYKYQYPEAHIQALMRLIDWMMKLPAKLEPIFAQALSKIDRENKMAFVPSYERLAIEKGVQKGKLEGESDLLLRLLARKFGGVPKVAKERIHAASSAQLETWSLNILDAETLDEVFMDGR
ncbi:MAG: DUF4351 domain-containing protein [Alcaligenaceae bacterium]|nr:DUF4351 domain-containing protein [Alcaligenaceae bacterium]